LGASASRVHERKSSIGGRRLSGTTSWGELESAKCYLESGKGKDSLEMELGASASRVHERKSSIRGRRLSGIWGSSVELFFKSLIYGILAVLEIRRCWGF
jgi:hypothetical protein